MDQARNSAPEPTPPQVLEDLRARLRRFRPVPLVDVGWDRGTDPHYLGELVRYWAEDYDWSTHEADLLALPWQLVRAGDTDVRVLHQHAAEVNAATVVLLHGWPDSFLRFSRVLPLLADLNVVVPCLPGFPYSAPVREPGMSTGAMAELIAESMAGLGYDRYVVSGGDVGSSVAELLVAAHPERVAALHLTDVPYRHLFTVEPGELDADEQAYLAAGRRWQFAEGAYALQQSTKPHTLAAGLGDSPAGLAAWIVEKLRTWSDCGGDVESVFPREDLLTWLTLYWVTGTIGSSFLPYVEENATAPGRIEVPTAVTIFPHDLVNAPRRFAERFFDVRIFDEQPDGGHFAAWERPEVYANAVRATVALGG